MVRWIPVHNAGMRFHEDLHFPFMETSSVIYGFIFWIGKMPLPNEPIGTPAITVFADQFAFYPHSWWIYPRIDTKSVDDAEVRQYRIDVEERSYAYHYVNHMVQNNAIRKGIYLFEVLNRSCLFKCSYDDLDVKITDLV
jgi:hypothetical protein